MRAPLLLAAFACFVVTVVCLAGFFGACASLVPGDAGGRGELTALVFAALGMIVGTGCLRAARRAAP